MGASAWDYWTDFDDDPRKALRTLRERVFRAGEYLGPGGNTFDQKRDGRPRPPNIEKLLERQGENQTHSILDVVFISYEGGPPRPTRKEWNPLTQSNEDFPLVEGEECRALSRAELRDAFGTERPTRSQIEACDWNRLDALWSKWSALCVTAWDGEEPVQMFFIGTSGD
jgi:hypothetical protein